MLPEHRQAALDHKGSFLFIDSGIVEKCVEACQAVVMGCFIM